MGNAFDLEAYFQWVNGRGSTTPTYSTLAGLLEAHMRQIPFENFDVLLGRGVRLDIDALWRNSLRPAAAAIASSMRACSPQRLSDSASSPFGTRSSASQIRMH
jgi:N-acetyltransferase